MVLVLSRGSIRWLRVWTRAARTRATLPLAAHGARNARHGRKYPGRSNARGARGEKRARRERSTSGATLGPEGRISRLDKRVRGWGTRDERPARRSWRGHAASNRGRARWGVHRARVRVRLGALRARGAERFRAPCGRREAYASAPCRGGRRRAGGRAEHASGDAGSLRRSGAAHRQAVLRVHATRHGRGRLRRAPRRVRRAPGRAPGRTADAATRRSERPTPARGHAWRRRGRGRDVQQERQEVCARRETRARLHPIPRTCTSRHEERLRVSARPASRTRMAIASHEEKRLRASISRVFLGSFPLSGASNRFFAFKSEPTAS